MRRLAGGLDRGLEIVASEQQTIREHAREVQKIARALDPERGPSTKRRERFGRLRRRLARGGDPVRMQMAVVMAAFVGGLFAGGRLPELPWDNLDLERWFRLPKSRQRRIRGRPHAGVRLVHEGATLLPVLDAHRDGQRFTAAGLAPYRHAQRPPDEHDAVHRRKVMRVARSKKKRPLLLKQLEELYLKLRLAFRRAVEKR
ncbi:MAG: Transposase [Gemmataceae bacterium]|nr:Transposase [Gemmataceae bacterium]